MNYIQKHILLKLFNNEADTFSALKPDDIESDKFSYHLRVLSNQNLIHKANNAYSLTLKGIKLLAEDFPVKPDGAEQSTYKVNILTLCIQNNKIILGKRRRNPFKNSLGAPGGNISKGERITDAAKRICAENTSLIGKFKYIGTIRKISYFENKELYQDIYFHITISDDLKGDIKNSNYKYADFDWYNLREAIKLETKTDYLKKIYQQILDKNIPKEFFFVEEEKIIKIL